MTTNATTLTKMNRHKMMTPHDITDCRFDTMKKKRSGSNRLALRIHHQHHAAPPPTATGAIT